MNFDIEQKNKKRITSNDYEQITVKIKIIISHGNHKYVDTI